MTETDTKNNWPHDGKMILSKV